MQPIVKKGVVVSVFFLSAFLSSSGLIGQKARADEPPASAQSGDRDARLAWWRDARFGMFIHWGPISIKGTEISWSRDAPRQGCPSKSRGTVPAEEYDNLYKQFNPTKFDPEQWVRTAEQAGMKYMVLTAKHCDGFCLWDSQASDYNISHTPYGHDICDELAQAAHKHGMHLGWYYSPMDWRDPDCRTERNGTYVATMQRHLAEILGNYGRIDLLWFDFDSGPVPWQQPETYALIRRLQPSIIINNRLDLATYREYQENKIGPEADYYTPEQKIGKFDNQHPWETCMTLGTQWSWKPDDKLKSAKDCIQILAACAGGDGNLLLNVGPMPSGEIEPRQCEILNEVGHWLREHGESIYGTRGGPFKPAHDVYSTYRGNTVYVHVLKWAGDSITLPALPHKVVESSLPSGGKPSAQTDDAQWTITVPPGDRSEIDTIVKLQLDGAVQPHESVNSNSKP